MDRHGCLSLVGQGSQSKGIKVIMRGSFRRWGFTKEGRAQPGCQAGTAGSVKQWWPRAAGSPEPGPAGSG